MTPGRFARLVAHDLELQARSRRLLLVSVLFVVSALIAGAAFAGITRLAEQQAMAANPAMAEALADPVLRAQALEQIWPATEGAALSALSRSETVIVSIGRFLLPFLLVLAFSDTLSGELRRRTLCYDTMHASREALFLAKLATAAFVSVTLIAVALASALVPLAMLTELITLGAVASSATSAFLRLAILALAFLPLVLLASTLTRHGFASVLVAGLLVLVVPLVLQFAAFLFGEAGHSALSDGLSSMLWAFPNRTGTLLSEPESTALWRGLPIALAQTCGWAGAALIALRRQQL